MASSTLEFLGDAPGGKRRACENTNVNDVPGLSDDQKDILKAIASSVQYPNQSCGLGAIRKASQLKGGKLNHTLWALGQKGLVEFHEQQSDPTPEFRLTDEGWKAVGPLL